MDQKRLFLAIAISVAILLGFQLLIAPHLPHPPPPPPAQVANSANPTSSSSSPTPAQGGAVAAATAAAPKNVPRVKIAAPRLSGSISLLGARLDDLVLTETARPGTRFAERPPAGAAVGQRAVRCAVWLECRAREQVKLPGNDTVWAASADTMGPGHPVTLSWENGAGLTFQIELSVDDDYMFTVRQLVKNATDAPVKLFPWSRVRRDYTPQTSGYYILFEGLLGVGGQHPCRS